MSDDAVLAIALTSVMTLQHFPRATDDWETLSAAQKRGQHGSLHSAQLTQHGSGCRRPQAAPDPLVTR